MVIAGCRYEVTNQGTTTRVLQAARLCAAASACGSDRMVRALAPLEQRANRAVRPTSARASRRWRRGTSSRSGRPPRRPSVRPASREASPLFSPRSTTPSARSRANATPTQAHRGEPPSSLDAAVAAAAHDVLVSIYSASPAVVASVMRGSTPRSRRWARVPRAVDKGVAAGQAAAANCSRCARTTTRRIR